MQERRGTLLHTTAAACYVTLEGTLLFLLDAVAALQRFKAAVEHAAEPMQAAHMVLSTSLCMNPLHHNVHQA